MQNPPALPFGLDGNTLVIGVLIALAVILIVVFGWETLGRMLDTEAYSSAPSKFAKAKKKADEDDDAKACLDAAEMLEKGKDGAPKDPKEAEHYRHRATELYRAQSRSRDKAAAAEAFFILGEINNHGHHGHPLDAKADRDYQKALALYEPMAQRGAIEGLKYTGYMYRWGYGCKQDLEKAAGYWEQAVTLYGNVYAMKRLAELYKVGVKKPDPAKAATYWRMAALTGDAEALEQVGDNIYASHGELASREEAYFWYAHAARKGRDGAVQQMRKIEDEWTRRQLMEVQDRLKAWTPA